MDVLSQATGSSASFEFGPFRLDARRRLLLRGGQPIALTAKAFDLLMLLIAHCDRVVTKEEIFQHLWPRAVVEDANLTQTVFMLRKALGENARENRYIVTAQGIGYRFGAVPRRVADEAESDVKPSAARAHPPEVAPTTANVWKRRTIAGLSLSIVAILIVAGARAYVGARVAPSAGAATPTSIVIGEFTDAGDSSLGPMLRRAASIQLAQSPYLKVWSDERIAATMQLMGRPSGVVPDRADARALCRREAIDATIDGSIERADDRLVLMLEAIECETGERLASAQGDGRNASELLDALNAATARIRAGLGESSASIRKYDRPLRAVTTSSLEALQVFSAAADRMRYGPDRSAAIPMFERAIELDPKFALAPAYLGYLYASLGETGRAASHIRNAYALRDNVSVRERLLIESSYHYLVTGDLDREIGTQEIWRAQYPHDWLPNLLLAEIQEALLGNYERASELSALSWRLEPQQPFAPTSLAMSQLALGEPGGARRTLEQALTLEQDGAGLRAALYRVAVMLDDAALKDAQRHWSQNQPVQDGIEPLFIAEEVQRGRIQRARSMIASHANALREAGFAEAAASDLAWLALALAQHGEIAAAREHAAASLTLARNQDDRGLLSVAYAFMRETEQATALLNELDRDPVYHMPSQKIYAPLARAILELNAGKAREAVERLEALRRYDLGSAWSYLPIYVRGLAHLANEEPGRAAAEFRRIVERRGVSPLAKEWPLAHLGLARALAKSGDAERSREAYEALFAIWKEADADLPLVRIASRESQRQAARLASAR